MPEHSQEEVLRSAFRYQEALTCYAYGMLRDWALAEDATQETFIVVQKKWEEFIPGSSIFAWTRQILRYKCLDAFRAGKRVTLVEEEELANLVDQTLTEHTDENAAEALLDRKEALRECMSRIDEMSLKLIVRFYRDAWSFDQLASWAGRSANTLRVNLSRTRQKLRQCIEKRLVAEGGMV